MTHPRSHAAFAWTWLLAVAAVAVWCVALRAEPASDEPVLSAAEETEMEKAGRAPGFIDRIRTNSEARREYRRLHPIRPIENLKETSRNAADSAKWLALACIAVGLGVPVLLIVLAVVKRK